MPRPINFCFQQQAGTNTHLLYIYDDVTKFGKFNWSTWNYDESETSAKYFRDQLAAIPDKDTIELHINSNGGSVQEGVAIYNQLKQKACHKVGHVDGVAYSIAFVILQACDERVMGVGTSALVHDMWVECQGNAKELRKMADDLDVLMESNRQIFMERSNLDEQQLIEMMDKETFLTPAQCLEYGLIDSVDKKQQAEPQNQESLEQQIVQLRTMMAQQKSFREQLQAMTEPKEPPVPPAPAQKTLANKISNLFEKM
ncbi:head maturation protease, ClpP-related [Hespellia stercorisuis]|uniref:ATP-dependent Clp protease proteolytic subunit n=1 Tax=Hespellia stercorisuis DSM 15480 TaxID=1121950 RepID=A0A1M6MVZ4_9FIRM|nr:head maturation protease, ClpP-related [Hespellia stercorisuis]SHJ87559.1 ATP-dependent protease ClpP, protease subunit [Hespellia stercorisuis DSM 15480]